MFYRFGFDHTTIPLLHVGIMNMSLHGIESPGIPYRDSFVLDPTCDESLDIRIPRRFH
jgi:hypothetical protein